MTAIFCFSESQVITAEQKEFISKVTERVFTLMKETPPNGEEFVTAIKHIMSVSIVIFKMTEQI